MLKKPNRSRLESDVEVELPPQRHGLKKFPLHQSKMPINSRNGPTSNISRVMMSLCLPQRGSATERVVQDPKPRYLRQRFTARLAVRRPMMIQSRPQRTSGLPRRPRPAQCILLGAAILSATGQGRTTPRWRTPSRTCSPKPGQREAESRRRNRNQCRLQCRPTFHKVNSTVPISTPVLSPRLTMDTRISNINTSLSPVPYWPCPTIPSST
jgi:hypothetical protein